MFDIKFNNSYQSTGERYKTMSQQQKISVILKDLQEDETKGYAARYWGGVENHVEIMNAVRGLEGLKTAILKATDYINILVKYQQSDKLEKPFADAEMVKNIAEIFGLNPEVLAKHYFELINAKTPVQIVQVMNSLILDEAVAEEHPEEDTVEPLDTAEAQAVIEMLPVAEESAADKKLAFVEVFEKEFLVKVKAKEQHNHQLLALIEAAIKSNKAKLISEGIVKTGSGKDEYYRLNQVDLSDDLRGDFDYVFRVATSDSQTCVLLKINTATKQVAYTHCQSKAIGPQWYYKNKNK